MYLYYSSTLLDILQLISIQSFILSFIDFFITLFKILILQVQTTNSLNIKYAFLV